MSISPFSLFYDGKDLSPYLPIELIVIFRKMLGITPKPRTEDSTAKQQKRGGDLFPNASRHTWVHSSEDRNMP